MVLKLFHLNGKSDLSKEGQDEMRVLISSFVHSSETGESVGSVMVVRILLLFNVKIMQVLMSTRSLKNPVFSFLKETNEDKESH